MRLLAWGALILVAGGILGLGVMTRGQPFFGQPAPAPHSWLEHEPNRLLLASPSGWQTVSMLDGGRTGLYYDAAEDLLTGAAHVSRVVLLGLGGGEMLRAAHRAQPQAQLTGVELDAAVIEYAEQDFGLSTIDATAVNANAIDWIGRVGAGSYDVVMVDLFDDSQIVEASTRTVFIADCAHALRHEGLFLMNVWPPELAKEIEQRMQPFFSTSHLVYGGNVVLVGVKP